MTYHIVYESCPSHTRAALFDDKGRLLTLRYQDPSRQLIKGAIVWGRVRTVEKTLGAAFVDIGDTQDGFLPLSTLPQDMAKEGRKLTQGSCILVRVSRAGYGEKGARLDARVATKPPAKDTPAPKLMQLAPSPLKRALHDAGNNPITCWVPDIRLRAEVEQHIPPKLIRHLDDPDAPDLLDKLDDALDTISGPLPKWPISALSSMQGESGGNLIVEITSAVATIDVNIGTLGGALGGMKRDDAVLTANLQAAEDVARLCRLLDLGGSVIVDFVTPRNKQHRDVISEHLKATCQTTDEKFVEMRSMSRHGLVEITRERTGPSLNLLLGLPAFVAGRILLELWRISPSEAVRRRRGAGGLPGPRAIRCAPTVAEVLRKTLTSDVCLSQLGYPVTVQADDMVAPSRWQITD